MGLYDVIDNIAEKKASRSDMGDNRIFGTVLGTVTENYNEDKPGRVCVEIPLRDKEANILRWARLAMPYGGKKWGTLFVPEIGDQVLLVFEDGNIEKPFVIGCVPMLSSSFVTGNTDEYNKNKLITSKNGNTIMLVDEEADEGANDKVIINSSNKNLNITLDNEKQCIELYDKEKKNSVQINSDTGTMKISVEKKLKLKVGDVELDINGESGNVSLKCSQLKLSADDSMKVVSQGICKLEAQNIAVNAGSSYKVSAGNSYVVESAIINLS